MERGFFSSAGGRYPVRCCGRTLHRWNRKEGESWTNGVSKSPLPPQQPQPLRTEQVHSTSRCQPAPLCQIETALAVMASPASSPAPEFCAPRAKEPPSSAAARLHRGRKRRGSIHDSDFYSTLLKELIERRSGVVQRCCGRRHSGNDALRLTRSRREEKKGAVDTRASKGRKLRYEVNEKIVNFMPPIRDRVKWGEEQIERLFRQFASSSMGVVREADEEKRRRRCRRRPIWVDCVCSVNAPIFSLHCAGSVFTCCNVCTLHKPTQYPGPCVYERIR